MKKKKRTKQNVEGEMEKNKRHFQIVERNKKNSG